MLTILEYQRMRTSGHGGWSIQVDGEDAHLYFTEVSYLSAYPRLVELARDKLRHDQDGYIFLYNIGSLDSFHAIEPAYRDVVKLKEDRGFSAVLVGWGYLDEEEAVVGSEMRKGLAKELGIEYFDIDREWEASKAEGPFLEVVRQMRQRRRCELNPSWSRNAKAASSDTVKSRNQLSPSVG